MKNRKNYIIIYLLLNLLFAEDLIAPDLHSLELIEYLNENYKTQTVLGYSNARDILYSQIDNNKSSFR